MRTGEEVRTLERVRDGRGEPAAAALRARLRVRGAHRARRADPARGRQVPRGAARARRGGPAARPEDRRALLPVRRPGAAVGRGRAAAHALPVAPRHRRRGPADGHLVARSTTPRPTPQFYGQIDRRTNSRTGPMLTVPLSHAAGAHRRHPGGEPARRPAVHATTTWPFSRPSPRASRWRSRTRASTRACARRRRTCASRWRRCGATCAHRIRFRDLIGSSKPMQRGVPAHGERRELADRGADRGRDRHRQGAGRARHPRGEPARREAVRRDQLRRAQRDAARERAVRPPPRRVHRRAAGPRGDCSRPPPAARSCSTRSARCRRRCRSSCCASCRRARSSRSARRARARSTCA